MRRLAARKRRERRRRAVDVLAAAALISCCFVPGRARGEEHQQLTRGEYGRLWYEKYCTPCHGQGGAPGSAVFSNSKEPVDLRVYDQHRHRVVLTVLG